MKIIDLLNKIVNEEEVPKKIKWENMIYSYNKEEKDYETWFEDNSGLSLFNLVYITTRLNDEVEILEEEKEQVKPLTKKDIEALGYACGEIQKCFTNGWTKSLENKPLEEENKIPEKLKIEQDGQTYNNFYIVNQNGTKCYLTKHSKMIVETLNQVIDYLKSKGE